MIATKRILCVFIFAFFAAESELGTVRAARVLGDLQAASIPTQDPPKSDPQNAVAKGQLEEVPPNDSQSDHAFTTLENAHPEAFKALTKDLDLQKMGHAMNLVTNSSMSSADMRSGLSTLVREMAQQEFAQRDGTGHPDDQKRLLFLQGLVNLAFTLFVITLTIIANASGNRIAMLMNQAKTFCQLIVLSSFNCLIMLTRSLMMFERYQSAQLAGALIGTFLGIVYVVYIVFEYRRLVHKFDDDKTKCRNWLNAQMTFWEKVPGELGKRYQETFPGKTADSITDDEFKEFLTTNGLSDEQQKSIVDFRAYAKSMREWHDLHMDSPHIRRPDPVDSGLSPFPPSPTFGSVSVSGAKDDGCFLCNIHFDTGSCSLTEDWSRCKDRHLQFSFGKKGIEEIQKRTSPPWYEEPPSESSVETAKSEPKKCYRDRPFKEIKSNEWQLFYGGKLNNDGSPDTKQVYQTCGTERYRYACTAKQSMLFVTIFMPICIAAITIPFMGLLHRPE